MGKVFATHENRYARVDTSRPLLVPDLGTIKGLDLSTQAALQFLCARLQLQITAVKLASASSKWLDS